MTDSHRVLFESYRPGIPSRPWTTEPEKDAVLAAELTAKASGAIDAVRHLIAGDALSQEDIIALGRLNFHAFLSGWEPMVALYDDVPKLDPAVGPMLLTYSKYFS